MNPNTIRFIIAARKASISGMAQSVIATWFATTVEEKIMPQVFEAITSQLLKKELAEALKHTGFKISDADAAELLKLKDPVFCEQLEKVVSICTHVAAAPATHMVDFTAIFTDRHWIVWKILYEMGDKLLGEVYDIYSTTGKGNTPMWASQISKMKEVQPTNE